MACKICEHPNRRDIEKDIMRGLSLRAVADSYDGIGYQSVRTHKNTCIPKAISASKNGKKIIRFQEKDEALIEAKGLDLVMELLSLRDIVTNILNSFKDIESTLAEMDDMELKIRYGASVKVSILQAVDRMVKVLDLYARIQGEVEGEKHLHIHQAPEMAKIMQGLFAILQPYPDAMLAVTEFFKGITA